MPLELLIIGLHRVGTAPPQAKIKGLFISSRQLEFQLSLIREMDFEFVTLKEAFDKKHGKFAVVTFDDGYADNLQNGFPVLQKLGIPATIFVITNDIGKPKVAWDEAADDLPADLLSWDELKYLQSEGWEIGSHNHYHTHLSRRSATEQEESILLSIEEIRRNAGVEPISFAYPYGDFNQSSKDILKNCGIKYAVTTEQARTLKFAGTVDCFQLPRVSFGGAKTRHYLKNISRLAKATGVKETAQALFKTLAAKSVVTLSQTNFISRFRKENS